MNSGLAHISFFKDLLVGKQRLYRLQTVCPSRGRDWRWLIVILSTSGLLDSAWGAQPSSDPAKAMQVLKANCLECHSKEKQKAGLLLTNREAALKGSESGVVLVPGKPKESLLIDVLLPDADPHMPPKKQLSPEQIRVLRGWVQGGAIWDEAAMAAPVVPELPVKLRALPSSYQPVLSVALSADARRLAAGRGNKVVVYDVAGAKPKILAQLDGPGDAVQSLAWSSDGRWLAAGEYRRIWLWDAETLKVKAELKKDLVGRIGVLEFTPDNATLVAADGQVPITGIVHIWDVKTATPISSWTAHKDAIFGFKLSHDGQRLVTCGSDKLAKLWELSSGNELARYEGHTGQVLAVAFNQDDSMIATGSADREIKIWDVKTKEKKINLKHGAGVTALTWTPDGKTLVAVSEDGLAKVYTEFQEHTGAERSKGAQEKSLKGAGEMLYSVASVDGKTIFAGGHDGAVYCWTGEGKSVTSLDASPVHKPDGETAKGL